MNSLKIINITDLHLTNKRYEGRKDDFKQTQINKLEEVGRVIDVEKTKADKVIVLINGDMFDTARIEQLFLIKISGIIKSWGVKVYVVPGNHDLYNDNISTLYKTHLGLLSVFETVEILQHKNPVIYEIGDFKLGMQGKEFSIGMENDEDTYMYTGSEEVDFRLLSVHGMLMDNEPPFDYFTLVKDVINRTNADILTTGHYHPAFKDIIRDDFAMFNPKSMIRTKRIKSNLERITGGKIITLTSGEDRIEFKIEDFELSDSHIPFEDAFKAGELEEFKVEKKEYESFKNNISHIGAHEELSHEELFRMIANKENLDEEIIIKAKEFIGKVALESDIQNVLEGYKPSDEKVILEKLTMIDFMCYSKIVIDFAKGTTAFIGRSGKGKSTVLRAIKWLYYNEPNGSDFIQTGKSRATVIGEFSNGYKLTRSRTNSSTGTYVITDPKGNEETLENFSRDFPVEVLNVHQTPKVNLYNKGFEDLAFSNQLDQHFLITASGGDVANAIGSLAKTQKIDQAIREVKRVISNQNSEVKSIKTEIEEQKEKLKSYSSVKELEKNISILDDMLIERKKLQDKIESNRSIIDSVDKLDSEIQCLREAIDELPDIKLIESKIDGYMSMADEFSELFDIKTDILKNSELILKYKDELSNIPELDGLLKAVLKSQNLAQTTNELAKLVNGINSDTNTIDNIQKKLNAMPNLTLLGEKAKEQLSNIGKISKNAELIKSLNIINKKINNHRKSLSQIPDLDTILKQIVKQNELYSKCKINHEILTDYNRFKANIDKMNEEILELSEKIERKVSRVEEVENQRDEIIKTHSICPLCGSVDLDEDKVKNVLERG